MANLKNAKMRELEDHFTDAMKQELSEKELFSVAPFDASETERTGAVNYSYWRSTLRAFRKNWIAMFFLGLMILLLVFTFVQPLLPNQFDPVVASNDPVTGRPLKNSQPDSVHWFGTNSIGQDIWARVWAGARNSLIIGISVALIEAAVGILVGLVWGYVRSLDFLFTEIYNVLDNIPTTIVLILISLILKPSITTMIFAMSVTGWIGMARFIRNQVLIIRDRDYNIASRCLGTKTWRIIMKNILPYLVSVIMLRMALSIPAAIGSEVFITYIGLGLPATVPSLGRLINDGRSAVGVFGFASKQFYQLLYPTIIVSVITVSFYIVGNSFSDASDPKNHR